MYNHIEKDMVGHASESPMLLTIEWSPVGPENLSRSRKISLDTSHALSCCVDLETLTTSWL